MKKSRFPDSQIIAVFKQAQAGTSVPELCREHGISSATFYKWSSQQCLVDDATGQLHSRLHTTLAESRLELGCLVEHANGRRGGMRGEGFELATAGWGNVHAPQGLLLSTTARSKDIGRPCSWSSWALQ